MPSLSVMLPLTFGAPAPEEPAVLDFLTTPIRVNVRVITGAGSGETAVVDSGRRAACSKHN